MIANEGPLRDAVTGAFGYTGRAIAERLLAEGRRVVTLTNHPDVGDPLVGRLEVRPLRFARPAELVESLSGVDTLYNTYWVRFDRGPVSFERAVVESAALFTAAREAGVRRIVHVSITNADELSPLPYFRGKGQVERALRESGVSHAIVRPTVIVGERDILIHNIAWVLRRAPVFGVAGDGRYRLQPVMVDDVARIAVEAGAAADDVVIDAVGAETFTFEELVLAVRSTVGSRARIVRMPGWAVLTASTLLGLLVGDVVLTRHELAGLTDGLLVSSIAPTGSLSVAEWLRRSGDDLGRQYANEVTRHFPAA